MFNKKVTYKYVVTVKDNYDGEVKDILLDRTAFSNWMMGNDMTGDYTIIDVIKVDML